MGRDRPQQDWVKFRCDACYCRFEGEPERVVDDPDRPWHPWDYFATCTRCGSEAVWARNQRKLFEMWSKASGPKTADGQRKAIENLSASGRSPESYARSRFNNLQTGLYSRSAVFFPARPGKYRECQGCEFRETTCPSSQSCQKKAELFMRHHLAFETKDPNLLTMYRADTQAVIYAILEMIMVSVLEDGVKIETPVYWFNKDTGKLQIGEYTADTGERRTIVEVKSNPLLRPLADLLAKNNMTLADMSMTPKAQEEQEALEGHFNREQLGEASEAAYRQEVLEGISVMKDAIERTQRQADQDPILIEHENEGKA